MRYEKIETTTHIYVEKDETEQEVLRAIVKASFELARLDLHFNDNQEMNNKIADLFIILPSDHRDYEGTVVKMDYVQGRQCKTYIEFVKECHFILWDFAYKRDPKPMLDRAKEILTGLASTS